MCDGEVDPRRTTCRRRCRRRKPPARSRACRCTDAVSAYEKDLIQDALKTTRGNRAKAARLLDTTERIMNYKVRRYGIDAKRFRS